MHLLQDVRFGRRMLTKNPSFTAAAVICLALGIGSATAIFSVVNAVILRPLAYRDPGQLVRIYSEFPTFPNGGLRRFWISAPEYLDLRRDATKRWKTMDAWTNGGVNLTAVKDPVRVTASYVTGNLLNSLGVQPILGRLITPADDKHGAPVVAVISYGLWQASYAGDPSVVGRDVHLDAKRCTIIGVMPKGFEFPPGELDAPDLWSPLQIDTANPGGRGSHFLYLVGRLRPGATLPQGLDELRGLVNQWGAAKSPHTHSFDPKNHPLVAYGFQDEVVRTVRPAMLMLLGAVVFVLLIACVNVANLLLARSESRQREIAIRKAMGAEIPRLAAQLAVEGVLLSLIGGALGTGLAYAGVEVIKASNAGSVPRILHAGIDPAVLLFTLAVSIMTGVAFGLAPLIHVVTQNVHDALKASVNRTTATTGASHFRSALVAGELSLALVLLIGCGLMVRAFWKLQEVNPGLDPRGVLTMQVSLPGANYKDAKAVNGFWQSLLERCSHLPGVEASLVSGLPPIRPINANDTSIEGFVRVPGGPLENIDYYQGVGENYFQMMGVRLIAGRFFDSRDGEDAPKSVVVNQTMARIFWPNQNPLGRRVRPGGNDTPWYTVVGVAADVKNAGLDKPTGTELYFPLRQTQPFGGMSEAYLLLKSKGDPRSLAATGRREIRAVDPSLPVSHVRTMEDVIAAAQSRPRFLTLLLSIFSLTALVLAAVGTYGVLSYSVAQRTGEFGIRIAMGAGAADVLGMVLRQAMSIALVGAAAGAIGAFALTRLLSGLLFGVSAFDPVTFVAMTAALLAVTAVACYIPARRATKVDPMVALRYE